MFIRHPRRGHDYFTIENIIDIKYTRNSQQEAIPIYYVFW